MDINKLKLPDDWAKDYESPVTLQILISTPWGVSKDIVAIDDCEGIGLEERGDFDNVLAWMPLPEPYKEEGETDG